MKACIYKIECKHTGKFYIGSTTLSLAMRLKKHRSASRELHRMNSPFYSHFREVGWDSAIITVIQDVDVESRRSLFQIEKEEICKYIESTLCLNHNHPLITQDEKRARDTSYRKQRREANPEYERNRVAEWRKKNPEKRAEQVRRSLEQQKKRRTHNQ